MKRFQVLPLANQVKAQKKASNKELHQNPGEANQLIAAARAIRALLGCH